MWWQHDVETMAGFLEYAHNTESPLLAYISEAELSAVVNLVYLSARDFYDIQREDKGGVGYVDFISGFGRYDIMLEPEDHQRTAFVLEFKVKNPRREKTLEDTLHAALAQIDDRNYDAELMARGIRKEKIRHYGFAFEGKKVLIG